jgi:hypothetical protein
MPRDKLAGPVRNRIAPPKQFKARRQGYYYETATISPEREDQWQQFLKTANAKLENVALTIGQQGKEMPLWITDVSTGYGVTGSKSQGPARAAFYPNGAVHADVTIKGIVPSNYMYDKLVEFVTMHHQYALDANIDFDGAWIGDDANGTLPLRFTLFPTKGDYHKHQPMQISCYIPTIAAGAQRFQNAREYELTLIVVNNYRDTETHTQEFDALFSNYTGSIFTPRQFVPVPTAADAADRNMHSVPRQADR